VGGAVETPRRGVSTFVTDVVDIRVIFAILEAREMTTGMKQFTEHTNTKEGASGTHPTNSRKPVGCVRRTHLSGRGCAGDAPYYDCRLKSL
jgi:hypothetical protein